MRGFLASLLALLLVASGARAEVAGKARVGLAHSAGVTALPAPGRVAARIGFAPAFDVPSRPVAPAPLNPSAGIFDTPTWAGRDSLPEGMTLLARALWGRSGIVRTLGLAPSSRRAELRLRRTMLGLHQRLALVTLGTFTTQVVLGELMAANPARYHESLHPAHRTLGYTTWGRLNERRDNASLSLSAPPARRYSRGASALNIHRALAAVHFTGMMLMPWLGRRLAGAGNDYDHRLAQHRWVGRVTYGAYLGAFATILLAH